MEKPFKIRIQKSRYKMWKIINLIKFHTDTKEESKYRQKTKDNYGENISRMYHRWKTSLPVITKSWNMSRGTEK